MIARILYRQCNYALTDYVYQRRWLPAQADELNPQAIAGPAGGEISMITQYIGSAGDQVYHVILSAPRGAELEPEQWGTAVEMYLRGMGLSGNAHIAVRHRDAACDHVHILVNRYAPLGDDRGDCDIWADGDAYARSRDVCRAIDAVLPAQAAN